MSLLALKRKGLINQVNRSYIHETLVKHNADVVFLQETWLSEKNDGCLSDIHEDYLYCSQSGMNTRNTIITGRPYGGVAILWKKSVAHCIKPVKTANRICAVTMNLENITFLFVCLYLPCDTGSRSVLNEDYVSCLNYVQELVELHNVHGLVIGGDFNTDLNRNTCQTKYLTQYIDKLCLKSVWEHKKATVQQTFESYCGRHVSVIDCFVCSINLFSKVVKAFVSDDPLNKSNHNMIHVVFDIDDLLKHLSKENVKFDSINHCNWDKATSEDINDYKSILDKKLSEIVIPYHILLCKNTECNELSHNRRQYRTKCQRKKIFHFGRR